MVRKNPLIFGLIGFPVKHSFSPAMHAAAFSKLKINAEYRLFEIKPEKLEDFLLKPEKEFKDTQGKVFRAGDIVGFNVTIPHKVRAKEILEKCAGAKSEKPFYIDLSGAINTVKRKDNSLVYLNTDAPGFLMALKKELQFDTARKNVLIIGCGGAGRAIVAALSEKDSGVDKICVYDKSKEVIEAAKKHFSACSNNHPYLEKKIEFVTEGKISDTIKHSNLLINASPVGMKENDPSIVDKNILHKDLYIYDVIYNRQTQLIKDAKTLGLKSTCGLGMLLYQGVYAFQFWTDAQAPVKEMEEALKEEIGKIC